MDQTAHGSSPSGAAVPFGTLLRRYRHAAGLTQEALAERAHLGPRSIRDLERGAVRVPQRHTVELLAAALALSPAEQALFATAAGRKSRVTLLERAPAGVPGVPEPALVGRERERDLVERHVAGVGPPVLLLAGEPGIGKSRLLGEAVRAALGTGWTVLWGGCQRRAGQEPYAPLLGALQGYVRRQAPARLQADLRGCAWLVRLLPELAAGPMEPLPAWTLAPEQERRLMFEAVARFLENVAGPAGTLLVLDDLQWAKGEALELLATLVRAGAPVPVRVLGAYRDTEVGPQDPLAVTLADLAHAGLVAQHTLAPLTPVEGAQLLAALLQEDSPAAGVADEAMLHKRVLQRAGGVPFFVVSCVQEWRAGLLESAAGDGVPWTVAQSVRQRVAALPEGARAVLEVAAVVGRAAPATVLLAVATQPPEAVLTALEAACQARLLVDEEPGYRFAHDVIREVLEGDLGTARRLLLHGRIAQALERAGVALADVETLAYHYSRSGEHDKALLYLEQAGDHARDHYAHEAAASYYREVAARLDRLGRAHAAARMREQAGELLQSAGQYAPSLALLEQAAETYEATGDLEGLGRVVAQIGKGHMLVGTLAPLQRLEQTRARLEQHGVGRSLAVLCARLSELYYYAGRCDDQSATAERAVDVAQQAGDERLLGDARAIRAWALVCQGRQDDALPDLEEAIRLAENTGQLAILCDALQTAAWVYGDRGEVERPRAYSDRAVATAERLGDPAVLVLMLAIHGLLAFFHGDWTQTRADCEHALAVSRGSLSRLELFHTAVPRVAPMGAGEDVPRSSAVPPWRTTELMPRLYLGQLCLAEGNLQEAAQHLEEARASLLADVHDSLLVESLLAHLDLLAGRPAAAYACLAPLAAQPGSREGWEWQVTPLLVLLAWAHLDLGDVEQAAAVAAQAVTHARTAQFPRALVEALWIQARVAIRQARWTEARRALDEGVALARRMRYPYCEARLLQVYGTLQTMRGEGGSAHACWEASLTIFQRLGARADAAGVERASGVLGLP